MESLKKRVKRVYEEKYPNLLEFIFPCAQTGKELSSQDNRSCQWCDALANILYMPMRYLGHLKVDCFRGNSDCTDYYSIAAKKASFKGFMRKRYIDDKQPRGEDK